MNNPLNDPEYDACPRWLQAGVIQTRQAGAMQLLRSFTAFPHDSFKE